MSRMQLHRADTLEGVWSAGDAYRNGVLDCAFSHDGKLLAVAASISGSGFGPFDIVVDIIETASGKRIRRLRPRSGWEFSNMPSPGSFLFARDALILGPTYDEEDRMQRVPFSTWQPETVSDPLVPGYGYEEGHAKMVISNDERWLAAWNRACYEVLELSGGKYVHRFDGRGPATAFKGHGIRTVSISPDNTTLIVSGSGMMKVIRLQDRKVLTQSESNCLCGMFSPDQRMFWKTCVPFIPVNPRTWEPLPERFPGHREPVADLYFSPNGRHLVSSDGNRAFLWDTSADAQPHELKSPRSGSCMQSPSWSLDGSEIWVGDGRDFIRFRLSDTPQSTQPFVGSLLYATHGAQEVEGNWRQYIHVAPRSGACLTLQEIAGRLDMVSTLRVELRRPDRPEVVKRVELEPESQYLQPISFSEDGNEFFYSEQKSLAAYRLSDGTQRRPATALQGRYAGRIGDSGPLILIDTEVITLVEPSTFRVLKEIRAPHKVRFSRYARNVQPSVTPDGRWLLCKAIVGFPHFAVLVNLEDGTTCKVLPSIDQSFTCARFSPDSRRVAVGYTGGAIGLWDLEALASTGVDPSQLIESLRTSASASPSAPPVQRARSTGAWQNEGWPPHGFSLDVGEDLAFTNEGGVFSLEGQWNVGGLTINENAPSLKGMRSKIVADPAIVKPMPPARGEMVKADLELEAEGGAVRIYRQVNMGSSGAIRWLDYFQNLQDHPISLKIAYTSALGGGLDALRTRAGLPPRADSSGRLLLGERNTALGMVTTHDGTTRGMGLCYSSEEPRLVPDVRWDEAGQSVITEWTVLLEPHERCALVQQFEVKPAQQGLAGVGVLPALSVKELRDVNVLLWKPHLLNFSTTKYDDTDLNNLAKRTRLSPEGNMKDSRGFWFRPPVPDASGPSMELGADRVFELWMQDWPASFFNIAQLPDTPGSTSPRYVKECTAGDGTPIRAHRRYYFNNEAGCLFSHDELINSSEGKAQCKIEFAVAASTRFLEAQDFSGKPLNLTEPLSVSQIGYRLALVSPGDTKPAILLLLGSPGSEREATVRLDPSGKRLVVSYVLEFSPGEIVSLAHMAAQRPLSAYTSTASALAEVNTGVVLSRSRELSWPQASNWTSKVSEAGRNAAEKPAATR